MSTQPSVTTVIDDPRRRRAVLIGVNIALMAVIASVTGLNSEESLDRSPGGDAVPVG